MLIPLRCASRISSLHSLKASILADLRYRTPFELRAPWTRPLFQWLSRDTRPFAGVRSERFWLAVFAFAPSIAFLRTDLADPRLDLVCSRVSVESFWINDRGCPSASLRQDAFRFPVLCEWLRLRKPRP